MAIRPQARASLIRETVKEDDRVRRFDESMTRRGEVYALYYDVSEKRALYKSRVESRDKYSQRGSLP